MGAGAGRGVSHIIESASVAWAGSSDMPAIRVAEVESEAKGPGGLVSTSTDLWLLRMRLAAVNLSS
jgi:hypothetical protein